MSQIEEKESHEEVRLYLKRAHRDLSAAKDNLDLGYAHIAVSRAYYAMFYAVSALLAIQGIYHTRHEKLQAVFHENYVKTGKIEPAFYEMIVNVFKARLQSDYKVKRNMDGETAAAALGTAKRFVGEVERVLKARNEGVQPEQGTEATKERA
jgi:uncharacterized protein (UPF0332 family)